MRVLLLGGTAEARRLAPMLRDAGHDITASLAGVTGSPEDYGVPTRRGGFGGPDGLIQWLREHRIDALIDATHPFADRMPHHAATAAEALSLPRLRLLRPGWPLEPGWQEFQTLADAVAAIPAGARVLATTGQDLLAPYAARPDLEVWLRTIEDPGPLPGHMKALLARPPFTLDEEQALLARHRITHLTTKNSGGARAKLDAAKDAKVAVHIVARPASPPGPVAEDVGAAVAWLTETVASGT
ncbi:MAG: cobalt-precorrin-6A reductase [Pseudomonadota bacterium]